MTNKDKWFKEYAIAIHYNLIDEAKKTLLENIDETDMIYKYYRGLNRDIRDMQDQKLWMSNVMFLMIRMILPL